MLEGLVYMGYTRQRQARVQRSTCVKWFKQMYGSHPCVYAAIWKDLQTLKNKKFRLIVTNPTVSLMWFLIAIHFLKKYPTGTDEAGRFQTSDRTARDKKWSIIEKIQYLKHKKIRWPKEWEKNPERADFGDIPVFLVSVDGIHCEIQEPGTGRWSKNPEYYSHKFKRSALSYEVALSVYQNKVVHINGPFTASTPDTTIFKGGIRNKIPIGRRAIVDNGYKGADPKMSKPNPLDSKAVRTFKGRARSRQECFNARLKNFQCLKQQFRHKEQKHQQCFEAVAVICQYQLENGSPLFDV